MILVTTTENIAETIKTVNPTKIAVAYVGSGWEAYLQQSDLKEMVISLRLGTNPHAVCEIIKKIGEDNVYYLDDLHSKIYLGEKSALIGSMNLSANGLGGGRYETGCVISDAKNLQSLNELFSKYKNESTNASSNKGILKLRDLIKEDEKAKINGVFKATKSDKTSIADFEPKIYQGRIHVVGYDENYEIKYNKEELSKLTLGISNYDDFFDDALAVENSGVKVKEFDWLLMWDIANANTEVRWMYVEYVVVNGATNSNDFTTLVGATKNQKLVPKPFDLSKKEVRDVIKKTITKWIERKEIDDDWFVPNNKVIGFLNEIKNKTSC
ncbi:conserved hypothetical protein [mine drainage metagenome]|uniref:PLD phosphodiesterase domain-containing protein n=1 Tax=mine drainage metagenome TaxID=410659 RepID=A0A3P3ZM85_9ZZZZ